MTMLQNQTSDAVANVLHDQGIPNRLEGIGAPTAAARLWPAVAVLVLVAIALLVMFAIIASRAT